MKVRVYYNLRLKCLSVQAMVGRSWKVIRHAEKVSLLNVTFKVSEKGRQRVIKNKRKNVHAYICGTLAEEKLPEGQWMDLITYNPYKLEKFYDGQNYVDKADKVFVKGRSVYAINAR